MRIETVTPESHRLPFWLCEVRGLIQAKAVGSASYAGNYRLVYFDGFKALQFKRQGKFAFYPRIVPNHIRSSYQAAAYFGV